MKLLVFVEDYGSKDDAPDRFEIHGEICSVCGQPPEKVEIPGMGYGRTEKSKGEERDPVVPGWELKVIGGNAGQGEGCYQARPDHLVEHHAAGGSSVGNQSTVENGKDGMKEGSRESHGETKAMVVYEFSGDEENACNHDSAAKQFSEADCPALDEWFGEGREERDGRKGSEGDRYVRQ